MAEYYSSGNQSGKYAWLKAGVIDWTALTEATVVAGDSLTQMNAALKKVKFTFDPSAFSVEVGLCKVPHWMSSMGYVLDPHTGEMVVLKCGLTFGHAGADKTMHRAQLSGSEVVEW